MSTGTKGPSNLYGNPSHKPTEKINFEYAVDFDAKTLDRPVHDHHSSLGLKETDHGLYKQLAKEFANYVDTINHDSFIDDLGRTYKYSYLTHEFAIIRADGTIVTYYIPRNKKNYWNNTKPKNERKKGT